MTFCDRESERLHFAMVQTLLLSEGLASLAEVVLWLSSLLLGAAQWCGSLLLNRVYSVCAAVGKTDALSSLFNFELASGIPLPSLFMGCRNEFSISQSRNSKSFVTEDQDSPDCRCSSSPLCCVVFSMCNSCCATFDLTGWKSGTTWQTMSSTICILCASASRACVASHSKSLSFSFWSQAVTSESHLLWMNVRQRSRRKVHILVWFRFVEGLKKSQLPMKMKCARG